MSEDRMILTPDEAISLLPEGEYVHTQRNPSGGMFLGCDFERDSAIETIRDAEEIEVGGPHCRAMRHPIVVWKKGEVGRPLFLEADMDKLAAFESQKAQ